MTLRLEALIEHWEDESLLFVRALPGFQVPGNDPADLHRRSGEALQAHLDWLVERELIDAPSGEVELVVAEEATTAPGSTGPRFLADLVAPDDDEIETALAVGRAAVSDLIDAHELATQSAAGGDSAAALLHIAQRDRWYASRLTTTSSPAVDGDPIAALVMAAGAFEDAVDGFVLTAQPDLFVRDGEEWTLAKLLRRRTGHLRDHLFRPRETHRGEL